jgi:hydrogenase expression/formation protein HypC
MCIAVPGRVLSLEPADFAIVDFAGTVKRISTDLLPGLAEGEWIIVHAGYAISRIDEATAKETIEMIRQYAGTDGA